MEFQLFQSNPLVSSESVAKDGPRKVVWPFDQIVGVAVKGLNAFRKPKAVSVGFVGRIETRRIG